jgi:NTP pyrophosphatase (non-canonical NTP hydrolase)
MSELKEIKELEMLIANWAEEKGLLKPEFAPKQFMKIQEELGELASAIIKEDIDKEIDSVGDLLVTIIILAWQRNINLKYALNVAYNEIKDRKGKMVDGSFVKEEPKMHREYTPELDYLSKGA